MTYRILEGDMLTVLSRYERQNNRRTHYQSEQELETEFINTLVLQGYGNPDIHTEAQLKNNLRVQQEALNNVTFTDAEWERYYTRVLANPNDTVETKTFKFHKDYRHPFTFDDGREQNLVLIDKESLSNNTVQVINQYESEGSRKNRYDVTILVNGLPLVHIELKRRGVNIRDAFQQIERYKRESFWANSGLYEYIQIFVISNGTNTRYYANSVRSNLTSQDRAKKKKSWEFTNTWADRSNTPILDLIDFTGTFFTKNVLLKMLVHYSVLTVNNDLLVMRPYQIAATESVLGRINTVIHNPSLFNTNKGGGYVWHTTGSGKTLTSFKTAQLATNIDGIGKIVFVVDRKDLDDQTIREYERFQEGSVSSNSTSRQLGEQLTSTDSKIIVTTIHKLSHFVKRTSANHEVFKTPTVFIFDECHRSQFGEMRRHITQSFKKAVMFGFTGTPIFVENGAKDKGIVQTTEELFGEKLHVYTIVDAIEDKNVLPFKVEYLDTFSRVAGDSSESEEIDAIDTKEVLLHPERISLVVSHILNDFNRKTGRKSRVPLKVNREAGFNSMFAVESIEFAKAYYTEFKKQQGHLPEEERLIVGTIFSYGQNDEEEFDAFNPEKLPQTSRDFLDTAISDFNGIFGTNYSTGDSQSFHNYYSAIAQKTRNREIDILLVVNMFLTGFDAPTMNTLWVDKSLRMHGLIQAFSRTNRTFDATKSSGNIVSFRNLDERTREAVALFGNKEALAIALLPPYAELHDEYQKLANQFLAKFPLGERIIGEEKKAEFVEAFGDILIRVNQLSTFEQFTGEARIFEPRDFQDYQSLYLDLYEEKKRIEGDKESILDAVHFEIELMKKVAITVDYILALVEEMRALPDSDQSVERQRIRDMMNASPSLRSKQELIDSFIGQLNVGGLSLATFMEKTFCEHVERLIEEENLNPERTFSFVRQSLMTGQVIEDGEGIPSLLPHMPRFGSAGAQRLETKRRVTDKLKEIFEAFDGLLEFPDYTPRHG